MGTIYLLHFSEPYKHARHYLGYSEDLPRRLDRHANGNGARLIQVIAQNGITWSLARTWTKTDRHAERRLKNYKNTPLLCPLCNPTALNRKESP